MYQTYNNNVDIQFENIKAKVVRKVGPTLIWSTNQKVTREYSKKKRMKFKVKDWLTELPINETIADML